MSEQSGEDLIRSLRDAFSAISKIDPELQNFLENYREFHSPDELDKHLLEQYKIDSQTPKLIEKMTVFDFANNIVWSHEPVLIEDECRVSSIIDMAGDIGCQELSRFHQDYMIGIQMYLGGQSVAIRYSQN
jgi:hypothetical protein